MNTRLLIVAAIAAVCAISAFLWSEHLEPPVSPPHSFLPSVASNSDERSDSLQDDRNNASVRQLPGGPYEGRDPRWRVRRQKLKEDPAYEWKTPIAFYGRVVDQTEQPVTAVTVDLEWNDTSLRGTSFATRVTDGAGLFSITGIQGKILVIGSLKKSGYVEAKASNHYSFEYAGFWEPIFHEADSNNPVVFHLRLKGETEPMIHHDLTLHRVQNDGSPTYFDLRTGKKTMEADADIALRITKGATMQRRFDWTSTVEVVNGAGLIQSTDEFMSTAPTEGYQLSWENSESAAQRNFQGQAQVKFYMRTRDGNYARVEMRIIPDYSVAGAVDIEVFLNSSGSTNLEFDRQKAVSSAKPRPD